MRQVLKPGQAIDFATPDEVASLIARPVEVTRIRAAQGVALDANGNGRDEVYVIPAGYDFEVRRVVLALTGNVPVDPSANGVALTNNVPTTVRPLNATAQTSGANAINPVPLSAPAGQRVTVNSIIVFASAAGNAAVTVSDGTTTLNFGTVALTTAPTLLNVGTTFANTGGIVTVSIGAAGAGVTTTVSVSASISAAPLVNGPWAAYMRSGSLIEFAQPAYNGAVQVPGVQTWSREQGPYLRNKEVFEVQAGGLTPSTILNVYMEGILTRPDTTASTRRGT